MCGFREEANSAKLRATEIMMDSSLSILLEGDCDELLFGKFLDTNYCKIEVMDGKENLMEVMNLVNQVNDKSAIAIIDADLDFIDNVQYDKNIFVTDSHDADTMMFFSDAFFRVAKEFYSKTKAATNAQLSAIRDKIVELETPLACLRIYDKEKGLKLAFKPSGNDDKEFPYGKFIESDNHCIKHKGVTTMIKVVCSYDNDQGRGLIKEEIIKGVEAIIKKNYENAVISHGHDLMHILALSLKRYGKKNKQKRTNEDWESAFRLAFSLDEFVHTKLYGFLKNYSDIAKIPFLK